MKPNRELAGLYLVVSTILSSRRLLFACEEALAGGVDILQSSVGQDDASILLSADLGKLAKKYNKPFIINKNIAAAKQLQADGIHFDDFDVSPAEAREIMGRNSIVGYTINNDVDKLSWAEQADADYVSFCSVFSKFAVQNCPVIPLQTIKNTKTKTNIPLFAAGGIDLNNVRQVLDAGINGIVITSAILDAKDPKKTAEAFKEIIRNYSK